MDELILIDMMSELSPELLQNKYIEKDMKRGKNPLASILFIFKKNKKKEEDFCDNYVSEDLTNPYTQDMNKDMDSISLDSMEVVNSLEISEEIGVIDNTKDLMDANSNNSNRGIHISIFKREFPDLITIISGITAASLVVSGVILFIIKHHKGITRLVHKKALIY